MKRVLSAASIGLALVGSAHADIVYSGALNLSTTASGGPISVAIAGNQYQFEILEGGPLFYAGITALNDGAGLFVELSNPYLARNFSAGDNIGNATSVLDMYPLGPGSENINLTMHDYVDGSGNFAANGTGYVGFGFGGPVLFNYGWMRFTLSAGDLPSSRTITLVDWAYESTVGQSIQVGAIPAPGAIAVAALAGLTGRRRRH